jgi:hypothetical protein
MTGEPRFALESCRVVIAGRLPKQHLSDSSYYVNANLVLQEGRRHALHVQRCRSRRAQIGCNNQNKDNMKDVERYCGNRAMQGGVCGTQGPHRR